MRHVERVKKHHYNMGFMYGGAVIAGFLIVVAAISGLVQLILPAFAFMLFMLAYDFVSSFSTGREGVMIGLLKRALGMKHLSMKFDALTKHFKLRLQLVPEHYKCIKYTK